MILVESCYNTNTLKGNSENYVKTSLALVASLVLLLDALNKHQLLPIVVPKEDKTAQSSENKQSNQQSSEKKEETKTHTFVHNSKPGIHSTLTYTVKGDDVVKQTAHNVFDPEKLNNTDGRY